MKNALKEIFVKYISTVLIVVTVAGLAVFVYSYWRDKKEEKLYAELLNTKDQYEQLNEYVAKLESHYIEEKEVNKIAQEIWGKVLSRQNETIESLSDATFLIGKHVGKSNGPDYYFETPKKTQNYILHEFRLNGPDSPALGYIMIKSDGTIYQKTYPFQIQVKNIQLKNPKDGRVSMYTKSYLVVTEESPLKKRKQNYQSWNQKEYGLNIVDGNVYLDPTESQMSKKMHWWAPHLALGVSTGAGVSGFLLRPSLDFSPFGYGYTKNDLDFKFLSLGIDVDITGKAFGMHLAPFSYRFFPKVLTNTYISPAIGVDTKGWNGQLILNVNL